MWIKEHSDYLEYYQGSGMVGTQTMFDNGWSDWTQEQIDAWNTANPASFDVTAHVYSIKQVVTKLRDLGLWASIKASLTEDQYEDIII